MNSRAIAKVILLAMVFTAAVLAAWATLLHGVQNHPPSLWMVFGPDIFYFYAGLFEPGAALVVALAAAVFVILSYLGRKWKTARLEFGWGTTVSIATLVFIFCFWASSAIYQRFPLCLDESAAVFQARIFASGHLMASIPSGELWLKNALLPEFIQIFGDHYVIESYLPIYSLLLALGIVIFGTPWIVNPLIAAGSLLVIYGLGRNLPYGRAFAGWSVVLLATSSQFLVNGFSAYAMASHLLLSLAWLCCYTHPNRRFYYICPPLGVLATGLHQPVCHALFVLPFLVRLVRDRRWSDVTYSGIVYLAGVLVWGYWLHIAPSRASAYAAQTFGLPNTRTLFICYLSVIELLTWQNLLCAIFVIGALFNARAMPPFVRDLAASVALTLFFYVFMGIPQGAGWGYRFLHPVLGNLALIAAWGATQYSVSRLNFASMTVIALALQLPYRCLEVREVVGHQAAAYAAMAHVDSDYVIVDRCKGWSTIDLIRNDPDFRNRPIMVNGANLTPSQLAKLLHGRKSVVISTGQFRRLHVPLLPGLPANPGEPTDLKGP